jgi:hypothetical protein
LRIAILPTRKIPLRLDFSASPRGGGSVIRDLELSDSRRLAAPARAAEPGWRYYGGAPHPRKKACAARLYVATNDRRLVALDVATGMPCSGFGVGGTVVIVTAPKMLYPGEQEYIVMSRYFSRAIQKR